MTTDNKTLADVQPGGRVRLGDRPKDGEVLVEVSGLTGSGKSAIAGEIEILCKALGLDAEWVNGDEEKRLTHADWIGALEMYKPKVVIVERNIPRAALSAQPSPGGQGYCLRYLTQRELDSIGSQAEGMDGEQWDRWVQAKFAEVNGLTTVDSDRFTTLAARQPVYVQGCDKLRARIEGERAAYMEGLEEGKKIAARQPVEMTEGAMRAAASRQTASAESNATAEALIAWARQPVGEPVAVEAVATVRRNSDGDRYIDWLTEGGIADLEAGDVLMVSDRAITDEDGSGEVYAAPTAQAVDLGAVREALQAAEGLATVCASVDGYSREEVAASGRAMRQQFADALAKVDSQAAGK